MINGLLLSVLIVVVVIKIIVPIITIAVMIERFGWKDTIKMLKTTGIWKQEDAFK